MAVKKPPEAPHGAAVSTDPLASVDALDEGEFQRRLDETRSHIDAIRGLWPGLVRLEALERTRGASRVAFILAGPFGLLLDLLNKEPSSTVAGALDHASVMRQWHRLRSAFDLIGDEDDGTDPDRFEVGLLRRRYTRMRDQQEVADALDDLGRLFRDDALAVANRVGPTAERALDLARTLSRGSLKPLFAPVTDGLRALTRAANATNAAKAEADKAKATADKPTDKPAPASP